MAKRSFTPEEDAIILRNYSKGNIKDVYLQYFEGKRSYSTLANRIMYLKHTGILQFSRRNTIN